MSSEGGLLRLYVTGSGPRAEAAVVCARALCHETGAEPYALEIVNVVDQPDIAAAAGVVLTPTLVRVRPLPSLRWVGELTDVDTLRDAFGAHDD